MHMLWKKILMRNWGNLRWFPDHIKHLRVLIYFLLLFFLGTLFAIGDESEAIFIFFWECIHIICIKFCYSFYLIQPPLSYIFELLHSRTLAKTKRYRIIFLLELGGCFLIKERETKRDDAHNFKRLFTKSEEKLFFGVNDRLWGSFDCFCLGKRVQRLRWGLSWKIHVGLGWDSSVLFKKRKI